MFEYKGDVWKYRFKESFVQEEEPSCTQDIHGTDLLSAQPSALTSEIIILSHLPPVRLYDATPSHVYVFSFFQDGLKTADKLKQYIEKLAADLYNVSTFL